MSDLNTAEILDLPVAEIGPGPLVRTDRLDEAHAELLRPMLDQVPPIMVRETGGGAWSLIDGQHRLAAAKREGRQSIRSVVVALSDSEALEAAVKANTSHGKALTLTERKSAAEKMIASTDWSDRRIAAACGLHRVTVGKARPDDPGGRNRPRVGTDGKKYDAVDRAKARKEAEPAAPEMPTKCTDGYDCAATPGPDGLCAWHRGRRLANKAAEPEGTPASPPVPESPGEAGDVPPTSAAAPAVNDGGGQEVPPATPVTPELTEAAERAAISAEMVAARPLLNRDPAEVVALMSTEDAATWIAHKEDMADWFTGFDRAMTDRNQLRSV